MLSQHYILRPISFTESNQLVNKLNCKNWHRKIEFSISAYSRIFIEDVNTMTLYVIKPSDKYLSENKFLYFCPFET